MTLRLKFYVYYRSLGPNRKRPTVVDTNKRIDALYSEYDEEEYDENQNYDETGDEVPNHDNTSTADSVSVEPPKKKAEIRCD